MRVLLNYLLASGRKTGIGHYVSQLLRCLQAAAPEDQFSPFPKPFLRWCWASCNRLRPALEKKNKVPLTPKSSNLTIRGRFSRHLRQLGQQLIANHLKGMCRSEKYDLYHEPNYIPLPCDLPTIATVHDLSILRHPEWHPADRVAHFEKNFAGALNQCEHFLAISDFGRREIMDMFNIPGEKITRTYMGVRPGLSELETDEISFGLKQLNLPPQYLLYLGTIEPRKNLKMLMQVYCSLPSALRDQWPLLVVGSWGWNTGSIREYFHSHARHRGVIHLGYVPEEQLNLLYNGARALVYPSYYEGFGLPPIEMMACGGAVIAATAEAVQETVGRKAHLIPPSDFDGWRAALQRILTDPAWYRQLRQGTQEIACPFTWEQCAVDTLRAYHKVSGIPDSSERLRAA